MAKEGGLKSLEILISAHANMKELKDLIKTSFGNDNEMVIYE
jgi:hypothetical protein